MLGLTCGGEACASPPMVGGYPVSRLPLKVMRLKFHSHEFQGYHLKNKHHCQIKAQMVSLMVTMKPRIREEKGTLRIRGPKMASGAARSMLVASEVNAKKLSGAPLLRVP